MSKIMKKTITQKIMDFYGWALFFCVYFGLIAVCITVLDYFFEIQKIWLNWNIGWKIMACIFYGGGFSLYSWGMYFLAMKFQVLSALLQAKMIKSKIGAERMRYKILKEYEEALNGNFNVEKKIKKVKKKRKPLFNRKKKDAKPEAKEATVELHGFETFNVPVTSTSTGANEEIDKDD